ncbi:hypothetical protein E2562_037280 [Oryza meyeriana var. granulata]|uniref:Uncharacterized protein n=1 Tax=Oryza meyeriana var. granulata TaxID=110450 RepID=A0A6G1C0R6_9ORYZ|nr:hypothetical protein E2562_037280 [Oryza meyeriana var. granulata]
MLSTPSLAVERIPLPAADGSCCPELDLTCSYDASSLVSARHVVKNWAEAELDEVVALGDMEFNRSTRLSSQKHVVLEVGEEMHGDLA